MGKKREVLFWYREVLKPRKRKNIDLKRYITCIFEMFSEKSDRNLYQESLKGPGMFEEA